MNWKDEIKSGLIALGGRANYKELYDYIEANTSRVLTKQWKASLRNAMETYSSDSDNYNGTIDLFESVNGIGSGIWGLRSYSLISAINENGKKVFPHKYPDGNYVVSKTKFKKDYIYLDDLVDIPAFLESGYQLRMSDGRKGSKASLFSNNSIDYPAKLDSKSAIKSTLNRLAGLKHLDNATSSSSRIEQTLLRETLLDFKDNGECSLCGKVLPVGLLVAAHIKKRSVCSHEEKLDFSRVATLMCKLGCDEFFERGYVFVNSKGLIEKNIKMKTTAHLNESIKLLEGRICNNWKVSSHYYDWHKEYVTKS